MLWAWLDLQETPCLYPTDLRSPQVLVMVFESFCSHSHLKSGLFSKNDTDVDDSFVFYKPAGALIHPSEINCI